MHIQLSSTIVFSHCLGSKLGAIIEYHLIPTPQLVHFVTTGVLISMQLISVIILAAVNNVFHGGCQLIVSFRIKCRFLALTLNAIRMKLNEEFAALNSGENKTWKRIFNISFTVLRDTKLQSFQYKIIHNIIPCNKWLHTIKIRNDNISNFVLK